MIVIQILILLVVIVIIGMTLTLNTKSEGLGAAITGASDTYRGAVGVEEQKRRWLSYSCYGFVGLSFLFALLKNFFF